MLEKSGAEVTPQWSEHDRRVERWRPNRQALSLMLKANACLAREPIPTDLLDHRPATLPMLLVCGTPRSGTTLTLQILANAFELTYPDNISARIWGAPHVAIATSRSLRDQMGCDSVRYKSQAGISDDVFGPHDYAYFWERFFPFGENAWIPEEAMKCADTARLTDELTAMWRVGGEFPLMFRGIIFTINAEYFSRIFPGALFIDLRRNLVDVGCSVLGMRRQRYGTDQNWWGSAPPEREQLEGRAPLVQVAGQIHHLRRRMDTAISNLPAERTLSLEYEDLCTDIPGSLQRIEDAASKLGIPLVRRRHVELPASFSVQRPDRNSDSWLRMSELFEAYAANPELPFIDR